MNATTVRPAFADRGFGATIAVLAAFAVAAVLFYWNGLAAAVDSWSREEYSYGYLVPLIAAFLFLRNLPNALAAPPSARWLGVVVALIAVLLGALGDLSRIADLSGYGFILALAAMLISFLGLRATLRLWM